MTTYTEILNIIITILSFLVLLYALIVSGLVLTQKRRDRRTIKLFEALGGVEKIRTEIRGTIEHLDMSQEDKEKFVAYASSLWDRSLMDMLQNERERVRLFRELSALGR